LISAPGSSRVAVATRDNWLGTLPETNLRGHWQPRAGGGRAPFPDDGEQHRSGEEGKHQSARAHHHLYVSLRVATDLASAPPRPDEVMPMKQNQAFAPLDSLSRLFSSN
jgi:hypothetical protein